MTSKNQKYGIELTTPFRHTQDMQLRFNDIDALGHLNNSVYFILFDLAKSSYFNEVRGEEINWTEADIVIANINCNFFAPTFFHEKVAVQTQTVRVGQKSIQLVQQLFNTTTGEVKAQCSVVMVSYDLATNTSQPLSEKWRTALAKYEGRNLE